MGSIFGSVQNAANYVMNGGVTNTAAGVLGINNQFQAPNPYAPSYLQQAVNNQGQLYGQQQGLAGTLQQQMMGQGPNPAQTQYLQNVQNNIANSQGLIAGQRGLNPGVATKMGSNLASSANQQAAAQASLLQQQQELGATQNLGNLYGQMQGGNLAQQGLYGQQGLGTAGINAGVSAANQAARTQLIGGGIQGASSILAAGMAHGGEVLKENYADGGSVGPGIKDTSADYNQYLEPLKSAGIYLAPVSNPNPGMKPMQLAQGPIRRSPGSLGSQDTSQMNQNVNVLGAMNPSQLSLGENPNPTFMNQAKGGKIPMNFKPGGHVPGKAKVSGDSLRNDTVPAMLSPGEIVVPRSVVHSENAPDKAARFVAAIMARENMKKRKG